MTDALPASVRATLEQLATRYAHDNPVWQLIADLLAQQGQRPEQQPPLAAQETAGWQPIETAHPKQHAKYLGIVSFAHPSLEVYH